MNTKKLLAIALTAGAAVAASATDVSQLRIYVNPGHGSWTGGDRAMATIKHGPYNGTNTPDTTGFFESNTNMWKGLYLTQKLVDYGLTFDATKNQDNPNPARRGAALDLTNNVVMSHVKLGPYPLDNGDDEAYNRSLYEIACEVERNNFDFFISVHSNAHVDGNNTNYPAIFVRGENSVASVEGSDEAGKTLWPYAYQDEHQCWSNFSMTSPAIYYDVDFWSGDYAINNIDGKVYKGYYGVLRHGVKGFLCEGYFHTYQPGRHRAMNPDVCRHEGLGYAHGLAAIFGLQTESTGELYGIVRDRHERFRHQYYNCKASSYDAFKPINNAQVTLFRDGTQVATYTTDDEYNGAFVFRDLEPGQYTIAVTAEGYLPAEAEYCGPFTVEASKTTYPRVYLTAEGYVPPAIEYFDYPDPAKDFATVLAPDYKFERTFTDKVSAALKNKTVKRMIYRNDKIYVLAYDADNKASVVVLDEGRLSTLSTPGTEGCEGTDRALADIQVTSDGVLIGCSMELCHLSDDYIEEGETRGECNIYRWTNNAESGVPEGNPTIWFTTKMTGNLYRAWTGQTMAYSGTSEEGRMILSSASTYYNRKIFFTIIDVAEGTKSSESFSNKVDGVCEYFNVDDLQEFTFSVSPVNTQSIIAESSNLGAAQYTMDQTALDAELSTDLVPAKSQQAGFFRYAGHSLMVAPATDADGKNTGILLLDITDGLDKATLIGTENGALEAAEGVAAACGRTEVDTDEEGNVTAAYMTIYLIRNNGRITRLTTRGVEQPVSVPAYAYGLSQDVVPGESKVNVKFNLTGDANVHIVARNTLDNTEVVMPSFAATTGENSAQIDFANLQTAPYTWDVVVENKAVAAVKELFNVPVEGNGVAVDNNPASPFFGNAYFTLKEGDRGVWVFNQMLEQQNQQPYLSGVWDSSIGASCWRVATLENGTVLISDWGDKEGGIYKFDPANPTEPRKPLFIGTQNPSSGEITNANGQIIAGSTSGMCALGSGENQVLYSFQEDYPSNYTMSMVAYNIGNATEISTVPDVEFPTLSPYLINGNVNVVATPKALFLSQTRGAGNNAKGVPVFLVSDYEQNILFNSGADWEELNGGDGALAVNNDMSVMVVTDATQVAHVMYITWEPTFSIKEVTSFPLGSADTYQMAFDLAGRLYVANRAFVAAYTVPQDRKNVVTPSGLTFNAVSGVSNVAVDNCAPVEYFNLQGMPVDADNLTPGIYIRRQGTSVSKVMVR